MAKLPSISSSHPNTSYQNDKDQKYLSEFHEIQQLIKSTISTKKSSLKNEFGQILSQANKSDLCHDDWESWASKHGKKLSLRYTTNEIRQLRKWFLELDTDGSGEVSYEELVDPLLSSGIMKSKEDVKHLIDIVDTKGTGEINFYEFLNLLNDEKFCKKKNIKVLQNITRPSATGLSTAMRLSQERRKHLLSTVIDQAAKRQDEIDQLYLSHSPHSHPSHQSSQSHHRPPLPNFPSSLLLAPSSLASLHDSAISSISPTYSSSCSSSSHHPRHHLSKLSKKKILKPEGKIFESELEKVALSHRKQVVKSSNYVNSLESIVSSHKLTIATDNVVDTTITQDLYNTSLHTVIGDPDLDIGYKDGLEGRRRSLRRFDQINPKKFGQGTSLHLKRLVEEKGVGKGRGVRQRQEDGEEGSEEEEEVEEDYAQYDSHYTVYAPKEVIEKKKDLHPPPLLHRSSSKTISSKHRLVPQLSPIASGSHSNHGHHKPPPLFSFPSQRFTKSNLHPPGDGDISINSSSAAEAMETCRSGRITLRRQPSLLSSSRTTDGDSHLAAAGTGAGAMHLSPINTGRRRILTKAQSKSFSRQNSSSHHLSTASETDTHTFREGGSVAGSLAPKRRRSSVVKRFYRTPSTLEALETAAVEGVGGGEGD